MNSMNFVENNKMYFQEKKYINNINYFYDI